MFIRQLQPTDWLAVEPVYRDAFFGFPWQEDLSAGEVRHRLQVMQTKRGAEGIVAVENSRVLGVSLWDMPTIPELQLERGQALAEFAARKMATVTGLTTVAWERELLVDPKFQGRGVGTALRKAFISLLKREAGFLVLTRMRDDNLPTIRIAEKIRLARTGIRIESSQKAGVFHEYWFLEVPSAG